MHLFRVCGLAASFALLACSSDPSITDTQQATAAVMHTAALSDSFAEADGAQVSGYVVAIGAAGESIVQPDYGSDYREVNPAPLAPMSAIAATEGLVQSLFNDGTCDCVGDRCTFDGCGYDGYWVINGSISRSGDTYTFDLEMQSDIGFQWFWEYSGSVTITATSISGSFAGNGSGVLEYDGGKVTYSLRWSVDYEDVQLDGQGCPVGGSLEASTRYKGSGFGTSSHFSGSGTVTFGPSCGDATAS